MSEKETRNFDRLRRGLRQLIESLSEISWLFFIDKETSSIFRDYSDFTLEELLAPEKKRQIQQEIGSKGYSLALMSALGLLTIKGFVINTNVCCFLKEQNFSDLSIYALFQDLPIHVARLKNSLEDRPDFGDLTPALLTARSGGPFSMPGMMKTVINIGLNNDNVSLLGEAIGQEQAWDCYRYFCLNWISAVYGIPKRELEQELENEVGHISPGLSKHQAEVKFLKEWLEREFGQQIPNDPIEQLQAAVVAVFKSYFGPEAIMYRHRMGLPEEGFGTAVNVTTMAHGNYGRMSGSGVAFSHDLGTGEEMLQTRFAPAGIGDVIVGGEGNGLLGYIDDPDLQLQLSENIAKLVQAWGGPVDAEFVVELGELVMVQSRLARLSGLARINLAVQAYEQIVSEGVRTAAELDLILRELLPPELLARLAVRFNEEEEENARVAEGSQVATRKIMNGDGVGGAVVSCSWTSSLQVARQILNKNDSSQVILATSVLDADEILSLGNINNRLGVIAAEGSPHSHAAAILNSYQIAGAVGCGFEYDEQKDQLLIDGIEINQHHQLAVNGKTGEVYLGSLSVEQQFLTPEVQAVVDRRRELGASMWETATEAAGCDDKLTALEKGLDDFTAQLDSDRSAKVQTQQLLNTLFPEEFLAKYIPFALSETISEDEVAQIKSLVREGWSQGYDVTIRSAYKFTSEDQQFGKNPWIRFKPGEEELLTAFFNGETAFQTAIANQGLQPENYKYGSLEVWKDHESKFAKLTDILVGYNPAGKLDPDLAHEHLVGAIRMSAGPVPVVECTLIPETPQLRAFEPGETNKFGAEQKIDLVAFIDKRFERGIGRINFGFGKNHVSLEKVEELVQRMMVELESEETVNDSYLQAVKKIIFQRINLLDSEKINSANNKKQVLSVLLEMIKRAEVPEPILETLIKPASWLLTQEVKEEIFNKRWNQVVPQMAALENWLGKTKPGDSILPKEISLEFQARLTPGTKLSAAQNWLLVYGFKGGEEVLTLQK